MNFAVRGVTPAPQGSKKWLPNGRMIESSPLLAGWRDAVQQAALRCRSENGLETVLDCPVTVSVIFLFARPQGHFGKKGLRRTAPRWMAQRPDVDKLQRSLLDGITDVLIRDDAQVVTISASKRWCVGEEMPGCICSVVEHLPEPDRSGTVAS